MDKQTSAEIFADGICNLLKDHKAEDVVEINVKEKSSVADYFVIATGRSSAHTRSLAERIAEEIKKQGIAPIREEGLKEGRWAVIDYGDVIVHVFNDETRLMYHIEQLWENGDNVKRF